jgi:2-dehydro-3-deoxyphosphogluconate aldolase/(4S)-4-hydroxy-2-oxoglutarate aldolase
VAKLFPSVRDSRQTLAPVNKEAVLEQFRADRILGLVPADIGDDLLPCARALAEAGMNCLELAMTTPAAIDALGQATSVLPNFIFGLGTVLDVETARRGILAGASFIATPSPRPEVITLCRRYHVPVVSGAFTRDDILTARRAGSDFVKVYPAEEFGPIYTQRLHAEFPDVRLIPIGGVTPETVAEFLRAGAIAAMAAHALIDEQSLENRDWARVRVRAAEFVESVRTLGELSPR